MAGGKAWTEHEDGLIWARYPIEGPRLELEGRGPRAVVTRACLLGVKYDPRLGELLASKGLDPDDWDAKSAWVKEKGLSVKVARRDADWGKIVSGIPSGKYPAIPRPKSKTGRMLEPCLIDAHFGKYAWSEETGEDYDVQIAVKRHKDATLDLLSRVRGERFDRVLLPLGQDALHIDGYQGTTTRGTPQDYDTRFELICREAVRFYVWQIEAMLPFGPVHVVNTPGNHGTNSEVMLCMVLEAHFRDCKDVTFDNSARPRKYVEFGSVGIGFTHGDGVKPDKLPSLFAAEAPEIWGRTKFREFHHGHFHFDHYRSYPGCSVRQLSTLCGTDAWHSRQGYVGHQKKAELLVWDREKGLAESYCHFCVT